MLTLLRPTNGNGIAYRLKTGKQLLNVHLSPKTRLNIYIFNIFITSYNELYKT